MIRTSLKAQNNRATFTELNYESSISVDIMLCDKVDLIIEG